MLVILFMVECFSWCVNSGEETLPLVANDCSTWEFIASASFKERSNEVIIAWALLTWHCHFQLSHVKSASTCKACWNSRCNRYSFSGWVVHPVHYTSGPSKRAADSTVNVDLRSAKVMLQVCVWVWVIIILPCTLWPGMVVQYNTENTTCIENSISECTVCML